MKTNIDELKGWQDEARRMLDDEIERLGKRQQKLSGYVKLLNVTEEVIAEYYALKEELERKQQETDELTEQLEQKDRVIDDLRRQLLEAKEQRLASETKLSELSKLSAGVAKKSSQDDMLKAMRSYLNTSKRKTLGKREAAKMVFTELFTSAKMELPEDITELLEHLDDEQSEPKVVNVTGSYNDIHDNGCVDYKGLEE